MINYRCSIQTTLTASPFSSTGERTQREGWEDEQNQGSGHQSKEGAGHQQERGKVNSYLLI